MPDAWMKSRVFFFALVFSFLFCSSVVAYADIGGTIIDPEGNPLEARVLVLEVNNEVASTQTGVDGVFNVEITPGQYTLIVYSDDPETVGFDYVPAAREVDGEFSGDVQLIYGSSLILIGDFQFVDTENIPLQTTYIVQGDDGEALNPSGFMLQFSDRTINAYVIPGLPVKEVILPADSIVDLNISCSILIGTQIVDRGFFIDDFQSASTGEALEIDVRYYTLPISQSLTDGALDELETRLNEMKQYGFYLARQETALSSGIKYVESSVNLYEDHYFDESFDALKHGFIIFTHTDTELLNMYRDAKLSVYLLIAFLVVASMVTGYLLIDGFLKQTAVDVVILGASLMFFYETYPGSRIIPITSFIITSLGYFAGFLCISLIVPYFFRTTRTDGRVHTRNLIAPIFNIAKRSLRRRRIRFMLTFISITLLVMSFVTLTSFSEGYGIISVEYPSKSGWTGVYIREGSWSQEEPSFILVDNAELNWITDQPETSFISLKAENIPLRTPMLLVEEQPIYGIIGFSETESNFVDLESTLIAGELPKGNGVLIGESLSESTGLNVGDTFSIGLTEYRVDGVLDDQSTRLLKDLDGTSYVPDRWVNISPEGEAPSWVLEPAEPSEVLVMSNEQAQRFPTVGVQRIAIGLNQGYDAAGFAERLALERGYLSWSNTAEAYTSYRLGNYFQGKGAALVIPWVIVVLNVVVTMLNSLYERRKEIEILSSVGLNPAQVSSIFVAEAVITGFIAGGLGYLIGLGFYKSLAILNIGLQVHQKVSAVWSLAAIGLAISAVVTGAFAALRNSVVITPSLMRRWRLDRSTGGFQEPWRIDIPIKLEPSEINSYLDYVESRLRRLMDHTTHVTSSIKRIDDTGIQFIYKSFQASTGNFYTKNRLLIVQKENGEYSAVLESLGETEWVHVVGSLVRRITMDYSTETRV